MNLIFGVAGQPSGVNTDVVQAYISAQFGHELDWSSESDLAQVGVLHDAGVICGQARSDAASVWILGGLYGELPEWTYEHSPLSVPNHAAEYLLHRYLNHGERFLDHVTGQYAVLVLDYVKQCVYLASDPSGMRTWYIHEGTQGLRFSTHVRSLAESLGDALQLDRSQEDFFLIYAFYPNLATPYKNIHSMPAGQLLRYDGQNTTTQAIAHGNPWEDQERFDTSSIQSMDVLTDRLYDAFMTALEEQSADADKAAVLLGGFDSALVASALRRLGKDVETFSFHYQESNFNQPHTDTLADYLKIRHHWIDISQDIFGDGLAQFSHGFNQPTNWPNYVIQTAYLSKVMRESGFHYCYSGDGCDTVFLGYPGTYRRAVLMESFPTLPKWLVSALVGLFAWKGLDYRLGHPYRVLLNLLRSFGRPMPTRGFVSFRIMDEIGLQQLRRDAVPIQRMSIEEQLHELAVPFGDLPSLRLAYAGKSLVSPNKNKMVGSSDQNGINILSPYLHPGA